MERADFKKLPVNCSGATFWTIFFLVEHSNIFVCPMIVMSIKPCNYFSKKIHVKTADELQF